MIELNKIYNCSCQEGFNLIDDESIDCILTDPPYGKEGIPLYGIISKEGRRILKPGGVVIFYASDYWLDKTLPDCLEYLDYFYLFHKLNKTGNASIFPRKIFAGGKSILVFSKGTPKTMKWINNVINTADLEKELHPLNWQQSVPDALAFINTYSIEGDLVLDPLIGSGTTAIACKVLNRKYIGFEKDSEIFNIARKRLDET